MTSDRERREVELPPVVRSGAHRPRQVSERSRMSARRSPERVDLNAGRPGRAPRRRNRRPRLPYGPARRMSAEPSPVVDVDIDDTLVRSVGSKRIPMTAMVSLVRALKSARRHALLLGHRRCELRTISCRRTRPRRLLRRVSSEAADPARRRGVRPVERRRAAPFGVLVPHCFGGPERSIPGAIVICHARAEPQKGPARPRSALTRSWIARAPCRAR